MEAKARTRFRFVGVAEGGQVVLEEPHDLPDGTPVIVRDYDPDEFAGPPRLTIHLTDEDFAELTAFLTKKRDASEWPEFEARLVSKYGPLPGRK